VVVAEGATATVTLQGVTIDLSESSAASATAFEMSGASVTLLLSGTNVLKSKNAPGIHANAGSTLIIDNAPATKSEELAETNKLTVTGDGGAAGIGGNATANVLAERAGGTITINGGEIEATGGVVESENKNGAAIGGGFRGAGGTITINGGKVTATVSNGENPDYGAAAIGGGGYGDVETYSLAVAGNIKITGGEVIAKAKGGGAAIGGGYYAGPNNASSNIEITGGKVSATSLGDGGAAIGGGYGSTGGNITITGDAEVEAFGSVLTAAIGSGYEATSFGRITISGGTVTAVGDNAVAIGSGYLGVGEATGTITISGGTVYASVDGADGQMNPPAIGGQYGTAAAINITGGTVVALVENETASAIGGGAGSTAVASISISDATVVANGNGIGAYGNANIATTISGGAVVLTTGLSSSVTLVGEPTVISDAEKVTISSEDGVVTVSLSEDLVINKGSTLTLTDKLKIDVGKNELVNNGTVINGTGKVQAPPQAPDASKWIAIGGTAVFADVMSSAGKVTSEIAEVDEPSAGTASIEVDGKSGAVSVKFVAKADGESLPAGEYTFKVTWTDDLGQVTLTTYTVLAASFTDVPAASATFKAIEWLVEEGISWGYQGAAGPEYRPVNSVTRAEMATFMYRLAGSPNVVIPKTSPFIDVSPDAGYDKPMVWLVAEGISGGYQGAAGAEYRPGNSVTRAEMATFMYRLAGSADVVIPETSPFIDVLPDAGYYKAMVWLVNEGISLGYQGAAGAEYGPVNSVTRAEMATFMYRLADGDFVPTA
jgi:hypothetical protein